MTLPYPVKPSTARRRSVKQETAAARKEQFWEARWKRAQTPREQAQVLYDRLRAAPGGGLPAVIDQELWRVIVADLADLVARVEATAERVRADERERRGPQARRTFR